VRVFRIILPVLLLFALGSPAVSAGNDPVNKQVPIRGTVVGVDTIDFAATDCELDFVPSGWLPYRFTTEGTGNVSHLGKVAFVLDNCSAINPATFTEGIIGYGTITFTAANGDVLVIEHEGTTKETGPGEFTANYLWQILGDEGTGRFEGATGNGTSIGLTSVPDETSTITLRGMIGYDASNRSNR
jgi:hypothetical protein